MIIVKMGWQNLKLSEKLGVLAAFFIAIGMAFLAVKAGHQALSNEAIGPLVLMAFTLQSTFLVGILRFRSKVLNGMFVEVLVELRESKAKLGEEMPTSINDMIAGFLGDKK